VRGVQRLHRRGSRREARAERLLGRRHLRRGELLDHRDRVVALCETLGELAGGNRGAHAVRNREVVAELTQPLLEQRHQLLGRPQQRVALGAQIVGELLDRARIPSRVYSREAQNRSRPRDRRAPRVLVGQLGRNELEVVVELLERRLRRPAVQAERASRLGGVDERDQGSDLAR
jgi:hypothetical protein